MDWWARSRGEVMRVLHIVFQTVGMACYVMAHTHSKHSESTSQRQQLTGEVGWTLRLLTGHLQYFCHPRSVACVTASPTMGTDGPRDHGEGSFWLMGDFLFPLFLPFIPLSRSSLTTKGFFLRDKTAVELTHAELPVLLSLTLCSP